jgi:hypothetical protein
MVYFWATWCVPSCKYLVQLHDAVYANRVAWKGKVRVMALSLDTDQVRATTKVQQLGCTLIEHYILPGEWSHPVCVEFSVASIPTLIIVNHLNVVEYFGHPLSIDMSKYMDKLLKNPSGALQKGGKRKPGTAGSSHGGGEVQEERVRGVMERNRSTIEEKIRYGVRVGVRVEDNIVRSASDLEQVMDRYTAGVSVTLEWDTQLAESDTQ